jgi:hypothetical protein
LRTVRAAGPLEAVKFESPEYRAVTVSSPTGALAATHDPVPDSNVPVVHKVVVPTLKVTVPVGVPPVELTVAAYVTGEPLVVEPGFAEATTVAAAWFTVRLVVPSDPEKFTSPEYVAVMV